MLDSHSGRVAIVTGARRGIGREIARRLANCGADIVAVDIEACADTAAVADQEVLNIVADVARPAEWEKIARMTIARYGRLDIVVNNAGIGGIATIDKLDPETWDRMIAVNLSAHYFCARHCVSFMKKNRWGRFVSISSNSIGSSHLGLSHYMASKMGVIGFVRGLANDLGPDGITVNAVLPGLTDTEMTAALPDSVKVEVCGMQAIKRLATAADIAGTVAFLTSDDAAFVTGQSIVVDGGMYKIS